MLLLRWTIMLTITIQKIVTGSSIAEEINFEVSNMKESSKNEPQVSIFQDMVEDQQIEEAADEVESSPSEIIETRVPFGEVDPEEPNVHVKRPRKRRRRRRRKRPKPVVNNEEPESYTPSEDDVKRKVTKYRPEPDDDQILETSNEPPRRRNVKRRRRPLKPLIPLDDYTPAAESNPEYPNEANESFKFTSDGQIDENTRLADQTDAQPDKKQTTEMEFDKFLPTPDSVSKVQNNGIDYEKINKEIQKAQQSKGNEYPKGNKGSREEHRKIPYIGENEFAIKITTTEQQKIAVSADPRKQNESLKVFEDEVTSARSRKRMPPKNDSNVGSPKPEPESNAETGNVKNTVKNVRKTETKTGEEDIRKTPLNYNKTKNEDRSRSNETKKDIFKLRRLPPISAILRQAKMRPRNENFLKPPFRPDEARIKENTSVEILKHVNVIRITAAPNETKDDGSNENISPPVNKAEKQRQSTTESERNTYVNDNDSFEFPIITYTELRQKQISTTNAGDETKAKSFANPRIKPTTTSTTATTTTESTAFIYLPCNQSITDLLKGSPNRTEDVAATTTIVQSNVTNSHSGRAMTSSSLPESSTENVAMKELEKLLAEIQPSESTNTTDEVTSSDLTDQSFPRLFSSQDDINPFGLDLDYLFQNKAIPTTSTTPKTEKFWSDFEIRQPKKLHDFTKHKSEDRDRNTIIKPNLGYSKDIILTYTSTSDSGIFNEIDPQELLRENELSLHLRNNSFHHRRLTPDTIMHKSKSQNERKKLPLAVKSAIIISGAILALAVLGFFALLLSCKIRHAKSRMKCHRELYREQFQNSEFRQSSRSTSPVVSKTNYNGRTFTNNIQSNVASNRNYYLWQTLRKTFQYD